MNEPQTQEIGKDVPQIPKELKLLVDSIDKCRDKVQSLFGQLYPIIDESLLPPEKENNAIKEVSLSPLAAELQNQRYIIQALTHEVRDIISCITL